MAAPTVHASAVLIGARAVLIRGPAGSGKSRLALALIQAGGRGLAAICAAGRGRPRRARSRPRTAPRPARRPRSPGLIEVRGLGIRRLPYEPVAIVGHVVDLAAPDAANGCRTSPARSAEIDGIRLPRLRGRARIRTPCRRCWLCSRHPLAQRHHDAKSNPKGAQYLATSHGLVRTPLRATYRNATCRSKSAERPLRTGFGWSR